MITALPAGSDTTPRWLVLGASGQLGDALLAASNRKKQHIIGLAHAELDITDRAAVNRMLAEWRPAIVVNAAAYTAVDQAETDHTRAFAVNRDGAGHVAETCAALGIPLVHISTDYVFDGKKAEPYREEDPPAPLSAYGASKAAGEALIRDRHDRAAIIRASWLFGVAGHNFVKTIANLARHRDELRVVADQRGCPTPAPDLAAAIFALGQHMLVERNLGGIFHFAGAEPVSWHGFAVAIVESVAPFIGRHPRIVPIRTEDYPTAAQRPRNSVLDCRRLAALGIPQRSWYPGLWDVVERLYEPAAAPQRKSA